MKSDICDVYYEQYDIDLFVNTKHGDRINKSKIGNNFRQREIRSILKKLISKANFKKPSQISFSLIN